MFHFKQVTIFAECLDEVFVPKKEGEEEEEEPEVRNLLFVDNINCFFVRKWKLVSSNTIS